MGSGPSFTGLATQGATPTPPSNPLAALLKKGDGEGKADTGIPAEDPTKQWWRRAPDSKTRKVAEKIFVLRAAGHDFAEIAKKLKSTEATMRQAVFVARKNGWVDDQDEPVDTEFEMAMTVDRKVVRNINAALDGQMTNWQTHEMTIAAAKGRGHFKSHEVSKNEGATGLQVVAIQVVMPSLGAGDQMPNVQEDQMGGEPLYLEGDVETDNPGPSATVSVTRGAGAS